jgi:septation ring formation regulator EzrA
MDSIEMMKENFISIPDGMLQMSERISAVINIVSDLARSNAEMKQISDGVTKLQVAAEG